MYALFEIGSGNLNEVVELHHGFGVDGGRRNSKSDGLENSLFHKQKLFGIEFIMGKFFKGGLHRELLNFLEFCSDVDRSYS